MKKIVLTFGLIAGAILSVMIAITMPFHDAIGFDRGLIIGYTSMVLAFMLIFFGIKSYRDNIGGGTVTFGRAFATGMLIAAVASAVYAATWLVLYYNVVPDYLTQYKTYAIEKARAEGESAEAIAQKSAEMDSFEKMYQNPAINVAYTFGETMPVALVISLVSAGVLSRRKRGGAEITAGAQQV